MLIHSQNLPNHHCSQDFTLRRLVFVLWSALGNGRSCAGVTTLFPIVTFEVEGCGVVGSTLVASEKGGGSWIDSLHR